jgi:hypothetical protein
MGDAKNFIKPLRQLRIGRKKLKKRLEKAKEGRPYPTANM